MFLFIGAMVFLSAFLLSMAGFPGPALFACMAGMVLDGCHYASKKSSQSVFDLSFVFLASLFLYSFTVPLSEWMSNGYMTAPTQEGFQLCMLALASLSGGAIFFSRAMVGKKAKQPQPQLSISAVKKIYADNCSFGLLFAGSAMVLFVLVISMTTGWDSYLSAGYAGRSLLKMDVGPIELSLYFIIIGLIFCYCATFLRDRVQKIWPSLAIVFLSAISILFVGFIVMLGIRRPSFFLLFSVLAAYNHFHKRIRIVTLVGITAAFAFLFSTFSLYRQVLTDQGLDQAVYFVNNQMRVGLQEVAQGELGAPFRSLTYAHDEVRNGGLRFGKTYIDSIANLPPSGLGIRSISLSEEYTARYFGDSFIRIGGNMGFFPVAEALLNFGILGVFAVFAVLGGFLTRADRMFDQNRSNLALQVLKICSLPWCFFFMRLDFSSFMKGYVYLLVPTVVAYFAYLRLRRLRTTAPVRRQMLR